MIHTGRSLWTVSLLSPARTSTLSTGSRLGAHVPCTSTIVRVVRGLCGTEGVQVGGGLLLVCLPRGGQGQQGRGAVAEGQPWR